jgi:hypothetical protein
MKTFAIIQGSNVINCITADSIEAANSVISAGQVCVEYFVPAIRDTYSDGSFTRGYVDQTEKSWAMQ